MPPRPASERAARKRDGRSGRTWAGLSAVILVAATCLSPRAGAHAAVARSDPAPDQVLSALPQVVSVTFDSQIEPVFSKLVVSNAQGEAVSEGKGVLDMRDRKVLTTRALGGKGLYHVRWDVISRDGHRATGSFDFTVR